MAKAKSLWATTRTFGGVQLTRDRDGSWSGVGVRFRRIGGWWHYFGGGYKRGQCSTLEEAVVEWLNTLSTKDAERMGATNAD
jgi:hypothetical protein